MQKYIQKEQKQRVRQEEGEASAETVKAAAVISPRVLCQTSHWTHFYLSIPVPTNVWHLAAATDNVTNLLSFQEYLEWKRALISHSHIPPPVSAVTGKGHAVSHLFGSAVLPAAWV